jgi:putative peptide zinc metalloprotease protein
VLRLVLPDGRRVPLAGEVTIGRASGNTVHLVDRTVSRHHARISAGSGDPLIEDSGSLSGTWVDGRRLIAPAHLREGSTIAVGELQLSVERPRAAGEAGQTLVVLDGASAQLPPARDGPRLRSGYALKRLAAGEGERRWVLKSIRNERFVRLADPEAELLDLLDGRHPVAELVAGAEQRLGPEGPARLTRLLAELADRGFLAGVDQRAETEPPRGLLRRIVGPREKSWHGAGDAIEALERAVGRQLLAEPALVAFAGIAAAGAGVFAYLVAGRYGTPFVVARKVGLGALVFLIGRLTIAAFHEAAHGVVMASFGRRVHRAGLKLIAIFPFVYVDTSDAWFEPRRRRIAISSAGPASDFTLAGLFSLCCLGLQPGAVRDVFFQLAFAAYVGGLFNLNPFVERDGYQILVDVLREPGLRRRAREQFRDRLRGEPPSSDSRLLERYSILGLAWTALALGFAAVLSLRYEAVLARLVSAPAAHVLLGALWLLLATPLIAMVGAPLFERLRRRGVEHVAA